MNHLCLKINLTSIKRNISLVRKLSPNSKIIAVVKADAYGMGSVEISRAIKDDVEMLAVATIDEAIKLRESDISSKEILVLSGFLDIAELLQIKKYDLLPLIHSRYQVEMLVGADVKFQKTFLKVETGMHRLGLPTNEIAEIYDELLRKNKTDKIILISHYHSGEDRVSSLMQAEILATTRNSIDPSIELSIAGSDGVLNGLPCYDYVRPGIMMYGIGDDRLAPALRLTSKIISIKEVNKGEIVGYNASWKAETNTKIGVVSGGYADGIPRILSNRGEVVVNGSKAMIIGLVSMDRFVVNLAGIEAHIGDEVEIFTSSNISNLAEQANTISYELLTNLSGARIKRLYFYE